MPAVRQVRVQKISDYAERGRRFPVGAQVGKGQIDFRLWAPDHRAVELVVEKLEPRSIPMTAEEGGTSLRLCRTLGQQFYIASASTVRRPCCYWAPGRP